MIHISVIHKDMLLAVLFEIITVYGKIHHKTNFSICIYLTRG